MGRGSLSRNPQDRFIVNAPSIFNLIWGVISPWIDPLTASKMVVVGPDILAELSTKIDKKYIPKRYGGECDCVGPCIPGTGGPVSSGKEGEPTVVTVSAGDKFVHELYVNKPESSISWEFSIEYYDIGFAVFHEVMNTSIEVHPFERCAAESNPIQGRLVVGSVGKYMLTFDNSYSMYRSKTVAFQAYVEDPLSKGSLLSEHAQQLQTVTTDPNLNVKPPAPSNQQQQ